MCTIWSLLYQLPLKYYSAYYSLALKQPRCTYTSLAWKLLTFMAVFQIAVSISFIFYKHNFDKCADNNRPFEYVENSFFQNVTFTSLAMRKRSLARSNLGLPARSSHGLPARFSQAQPWFFTCPTMATHMEPHQPYQQLPRHIQPQQCR